MFADPRRSLSLFAARRGLEGTFVAMFTLLAVAWVAGATLPAAADKRLKEPHIAPTEDWQAEPQANVLLVPPDVRIFDIRAGGQHEENAWWSELAESNIYEAMADELRSRGATPIEYAGPGVTMAWQSEHARAVRLHEAVAWVVLNEDDYPTQPEAPHLDYSLGEAAEPLRRSHDARYALFLTHSESFATLSRSLVASIPLVSSFHPMDLLRGEVTNPKRVRQGYASLVDLNDGRILWFRSIESLKLRNRVTFANPKSQSGARVLVRAWLKDLPL